MREVTPYRSLRRAGNVYFPSRIKTVRRARGASLLFTLTEFQCYFFYSLHSVCDRRKPISRRLSLMTAPFHRNYVLIAGECSLLRVGVRRRCLAYNKDGNSYIVHVITFYAPRTQSNEYSICKNNYHFVA